MVQSKKITLIDLSAFEYLPLVHNQTNLETKETSVCFKNIFHRVKLILLSKYQWISRKNYRHVYWSIDLSGIIENMSLPDNWLTTFPSKNSQKKTFSLRAIFSSFSFCEWSLFDSCQNWRYFFLFLSIFRYSIIRVI